MEGRGDVTVCDDENDVEVWYVNSAVVWHGFDGRMLVVNQLKSSLKYDVVNESRLKTGVRVP